jgi:protein-S-isoprenylcysteine O-methyltransferase Ste14
MYAASFVNCIGQGCLLDNWLAGWSGLVMFFLLYGFRVDKEEAMLLGVFGDEYPALMRRAGRLWPIFGYTDPR